MSSKIQELLRRSIWACSEDIEFSQLDRRWRTPALCRLMSLSKSNLDTVLDLISHHVASRSHVSIVKLPLTGS